MVKFEMDILQGNLDRFCYEARSKFPDYFYAKQFKIWMPKTLIEALREYSRAYYLNGSSDLMNKYQDLDIFNNPVNSIIIAIEDHLIYGDKAPMLEMKEYFTPNAEINVQ